jgi:FADH2 O2-dependent halogenase
LKRNYDIAVIGSGFAGSLMAMIVHRLGRSVALIDKGKHPRFAIGESSTPLTNLLLEELALRYNLPAITPLAKWGAWQQTYPEIGCGLKRGFTFYHHCTHGPRQFPPARSHQLLVAASPNDAIADTHWYRADFDYLLARQAQQMGIDYFDETALHSATESPDGMALHGTRNSTPFHLSANFVIDASGPRGFLHRALRIAEMELPRYPATQALYTHFSGVGRLEDVSQEQPPYPINDAAVHHVFDGGWVWVLHFNNGITSAGVAATDLTASTLDFASGERAWRRVAQSIPALAQQFADAVPQRPFTHIPRLSFRSAAIVGANWALLPSAAGFVDPLLSTGFPLTLLGIARLAEIVERHWRADCFQDSLRSYASQTEGELLATARLISGIYANMDNFPVFSALCLLYFAAASYSETARRLGKSQLANSFLLCNHPVFGPQTEDLLARAQSTRAGPESEALAADIIAAIEPFNVAGLGDPGGGNWYPVDPEDLFKSAAKVGASREDIAKLLKRCGF